MESAGQSPLNDQLDRIKRVRRELHMGNERAAKAQIAAARALKLPGAAETASVDPERFRGATVVNANGVKIGRVSGVGGGKVELELGGAQDVWGFWDMNPKQSIRVDAAELVFGPMQTVGRSLVALPTSETPPLTAYAGTR